MGRASGKAELDILPAQFFDGRFQILPAQAQVALSLTACLVVDFGCNPAFLGDQLSQLFVDRAFLERIVGPNITVVEAAGKQPPQFFDGEPITYGSLVFGGGLGNPRATFS